MPGINGWQLLIILVIVVMIFGTKKLRNIGSDLGGGIKSFKKAMKDGETSVEDKTDDNAAAAKPADVVDAKVEDESKPKA